MWTRNAKIYSRIFKNTNGQREPTKTSRQPMASKEQPKNSRFYTRARRRLTRSSCIFHGKTTTVHIVPRHRTCVILLLRFRHTISEKKREMLPSGTMHKMPRPLVRGPQLQKKMQRMQCAKPP